MKNIILSLTMSFFFLALTFQAEAHVSSDVKTFIAKSKTKLAKNQKYTKFKASSTLNAKAANQVEASVLAYYYFNPRSRDQYFNHMMSCSVEQGNYSKSEGEQLKKILKAATMKQARVAERLIGEFAKSATTEGGKKLAAQLQRVMKQIKANHDGRQSIEGFFGALGRLVGAVVGAVVGGIAGGIGGAIAGALAGSKLGGIIGDLADDFAAEAGGGNGVWAGPDGDRECTPPFLG